MSIPLRLCHVLLVALGFLGTSSADAAVNEEDLLPVDQAFALSARIADADRIDIAWKIADGYYLYRHRIKVLPAGSVKLGAVELPNGEPHDDEFFGRVETYRKQLAARVPVVAPGGEQLTLRISYQGCADAGVCYPPQTRTLTLALPASRVGAASAASPSDNTQGQTLAAEAAPTSPDDGFASLGQSLGKARNALLPASTNAASDALPLPPEQAFAFEAIAADGNTLLLRFTPAPGYYLYRDKTQLSLDADGITAGAPRWPQGKRHRDEHFGDVVVYFDQVEVPLPLRRATPAAQRVSLKVGFQGCQNEGICYPPMTRTVSVALPAGTVDAAGVGAASAASSVDQTKNSAEATAIATEDRTTAGAGDAEVAPVDKQRLAAEAAPTPTGLGDESSDLAEDSRLAAGLSGSGRWLTLLWFFLGGLGLAFTPCVLPMIPILSGLIAGQGTRLGTARALWLSFVYVLANALVFTVAGVIAGLVGANLQAAFQTPWVIVAFSLLFVVLALSSFGLYELQLPAALRVRLGGVSDRQRGGSLAGVAAMGALSALIVGPCVAPPLAAAVLYISQSHDPVFGGLALFVLAMGMGVPLLAFGAAAGRGMPTSGPWMTAVQRVFGFVFLALAAWMLSRIVPGPVTLALFGVLALAAAAAAFAGTRSDSSRVRWLARFAGLLLAVLGTAQLFGALAGNSDPLQPLASRQGSAAHRELAFRTIKSTQDLDRELAAANAAGKPLMFDFYADWCVSCKEMEKYTFTDSTVRDALAGFVLLKADVTANDAVDQALMQRFGIIGPPATLFFTGAGEQRGLRLVGFEKAGAFVERTRRVPPAR